MYEKVLTTIEKYKMIESGDTVIVGVSGGPDSLALLHILYRYAKAEDVTLYVAHLNHCFRGEEADLDAETVAGFAKQLGLTCFVEKVDVPLYLKEHQLSPQAGAREVRYSFFENLKSKLQAQKVATGHNADDQAETVLINLLRGTGLSGLAGIPPVRDKVFIRPLLEVSRQDIERYCQEFSLPVRHDASNFKDVYLRNRIRHRLIPQLQEEYNPQITQVLGRLSEIVRSDEEYLNQEVAKVWVTLAQQQAQKLTLKIEQFVALSVALQRRILLRAWQEISKSTRDLGFVHVENLMHFIIQGPAVGTFELPKGMVVRKAYGEICFQAGYINQHKPFAYELKVPGETFVPELNVRIECKLYAKKEVPDEYQGILVDYELLAGKLIVRNRIPGDRFYPLGMQGSKKIKDFFIDHKILREQRDKYPIIVTGEQIVWVGGLRQDRRWSVSDQTRRIMNIKIIE